MATVTVQPERRRGKEEKTEITAEGSLAPQFGSDVTDLTQGTFNQRILTNYENSIIPVVASYAQQVPKEEGGEALRGFFGELDQRLRSVNALNINKMIQFVAASKGVSAITSLQKKPGVLQRNITDRDWQKKAEEKGATIVE